MSPKKFNLSLFSPNRFHFIPRFYMVSVCSFSPINCKLFFHIYISETLLLCSSCLWNCLLNKPWKYSISAWWVHFIAKIYSNKKSWQVPFPAHLLCIVCCLHILKINQHLVGHNMMMALASQYILEYFCHIRKPDQFKIKPVLEVGSCAKPEVQRPVHWSNMAILTHSVTISILNPHHKYHVLCK